MLRRIALALLATALLTVLIHTPTTQSVGSVLSLQLSGCQTFYFLNAIWVKNASEDMDLYLETPANVSWKSVNQTTKILVLKGDFSFERGRVAFHVSRGSSFFGWFVAEVRVCTVNQLSVIRESLSNITYLKEFEKLIPKDVNSSYVLKPHPLVEERIVPAFEQWLRSIGVNISRISLASKAVLAAYFVYEYYFMYDPSALPRPFDQVVKTRRGDCDDLARVLVNMLWHYGIPAKIVHGYVYIPVLDEVIPVETTVYHFVAAGPHAIVMAYIPPIGWVSLDYLAWSYLYRPFIVESETTFTNVTRELVEEVKELHAKLVAIQVMALFDEAQFRAETLRHGGIEPFVMDFLSERFGTLPQTATPTPCTNETTAAAETTVTGFAMKLTKPSPKLVPLEALALIFLAALAALVPLVAKRR